MNQNPSNQSSSDAGPATLIGDEDRFLVFRIGKESFAAPLLSIREIVEPLAYRPVPNFHDYFLGLANLRGQIVGVLDLGRRFGLDPVAGSKESVFLVFDVDGTSMAGLVHSVETVAVIPPSAVSRKSQVDIAIPAAAWGGIAQFASRLLPVVHLQELIRIEMKAVAS